MDVDVEALCSALADRSGDTVVVSEEVGLSVHPSTEEGRRFFRDALGTLNQAVAAQADDVLLRGGGLHAPSRTAPGSLMRRALAFLTPFGGASVPSPGTLDWFPVVGAVIGLAVGACGGWPAGCGRRRSRPAWRSCPTSR